MSTLSEGQLLRHFRIEAKLGKGGMGEVYRAADTRLGRTVAIKVLPPEATQNPDAAMRFREEARLASALHHPNVVTIFSVEEEDGLEWIVMEYVEGETLLDRVQRAPLDAPELIEIGIQVSEALAAAHAIGLLHRDIKSANIVLTTAGLAKVLDFGLAKRVAAGEGGADAGVTMASLTQAGVVLGSPAYMSPEQAHGETLDQRSDIFSLGVTLYEAATGRIPFAGPSALAIMHAIVSADPVPPSRVRPELPADLDWVLLRAMAKDREERYATARELVDALRGLREGVAMTTAAVSIPRARPTDVPNNLPVPLSSFVGRRREREEVRRLFASARLVTMLGTGGSGKTRLAQQVARDLAGEFQDGVWLAELESLADPGLVAQTVAGSLAVREAPGQPLPATVAEALGAKRTLLLLDNCEHVVAGCAELASALLAACPNLAILATSQEPVGVAGEILWRIPTLGAPDLGSPTLTRDVALRFDAVRLFVERAAAAQPSFALSDQNARAVAKICRRLDGIPLAIELAAARVKVLSLDQIHDRLENRFQLLTGGSRTAVPRHKTLRAAVDWSYELLGPSERTLLNRMAIFSGGCTLEAAEEVCGSDGIESFEVLDLLGTLVDKSLLTVEEGSDGASRYGTLETIRSYGRERLEETGGKQAALERHAAWYLAVAELAEPELQGPGQTEWLNRLEEEHDNLRQAIQWFVDGRDAERGLRLAAALWRFWWVRGIWAEGRARLGSVLRLAAEEPAGSLRSTVLRADAVLARGQGRLDEARDRLAESLALAREAGDRHAIAVALFEQGNIANHHLDLAEARRLYEESITIYRSLDDRRGISSALHSLGVVAQSQHDYDAARTLYEEALVHHRALGNRAWEAASLNGLGDVLYCLEDGAGARVRQEEALSIQRELGDRRGMAFSLREIGRVIAEAGDAEGANPFLEESLVLLREIGDREGIAETLEAWVALFIARREPERAFMLAAAAEALRGEIQSPRSEPEQERLERLLHVARAMEPGLDEGRSAQEGRATGWERILGLSA